MPIPKMISIISNLTHKIDWIWKCHSLLLSFQVRKIILQKFKLCVFKLIFIEVPIIGIAEKILSRPIHIQESFKDGNSSSVLQ